MKSEQIIRRYIIMASLFTLSASLIWGVNTLFLLGAGLDIFEVFIANSIFTGAMAVFEIPTGVLADTRGRRVSFLLSVLVLALGTLGYVLVAEFEGGLLWFGLMSVVLGLGYTFYSGAVEAWLVDALNHTGFTGSLDKVFARSGIASNGAMLVGTISGGLLGGIDLSLPFIIRVALLIILFGVAYQGMQEIGFQPRQLKFSNLKAEMRRIASDSISFGWNNKSLRLIMLAGFLHSGFMNWAFYAWQPHMLDLLGRDLVWVAGVMAALTSLALMAANGLVHWLTNFCGRRTTILLMAAGTFSFSAVALGLVANFWGATALFLTGMLAYGAITPVRQAYIHSLIPSEQRATIVSFDGLIASLGGVGAQSGLGYLAKVRGIANGYFLGGWVIAAAIPIFVLLRRRKDDQDYFIGEDDQLEAATA